MAKVELWCLMINDDVLITDSKENVLEYCEIALPRNTKELFETGKSGKFTLTEYVLDTEKLAHAMKLFKESRLKQN